MKFDQIQDKRIYSSFNKVKLFHSDKYKLILMNLLININLLYHLQIHTLILTPEHLLLFTIFNLYLAIIFKISSNNLFSNHHMRRINLCRAQAYRSLAN